MIKLETIKQALEDYAEDVYEFRAFVAGLVAGVEDIKATKLDRYQLAESFARGGYTGKVSDLTKSDFPMFVPVPESNVPHYCTIYDPADNTHTLINSHLMTVDDRKALPLNVWIKHDGKSVPVLEDGVYYIKCKGYGNGAPWSNGTTFEHEFLWKANYDLVTAFMIKKIGE